jgi:uncharacterized protein DUF5677
MGVSMTDAYEIDGFLSSKMSEDIARLRERFPDLFDLLRRCNQLAMAIKWKMTPDASDRQKVLEATLFAREIQSLQAGLLLAERGMIADARAAVRSAAETAIYHVKTARDATFVERFREDHACHQRRFAKSVLEDPFLVSNLTATERQSFEKTISVVDTEYPQAKPVGFNIADVAKSVKLGSFYIQSFRQMSGDGAHTSVTSLGRHFH